MLGEIREFGVQSTTYYVNPPDLNHYLRGHHRRRRYGRVVAVFAPIIVTVVAAMLSRSSWPCCHGCCGRRCRSRRSWVVMVVTAIAAAIVIAVVVVSLLRLSRPYCHSRCGGVVAVVETIVVTVGGGRWLWPSAVGHCRSVIDVSCCCWTWL